MDAQRNYAAAQRVSGAGNESKRRCFVCFLYIHRQNDFPGNFGLREIMCSVTVPDIDAYIGNGFLHKM